MLLLLGLVLVACIVLIPLGLPGIWVMLAAAFAYDALVPGGPIGIGTLMVLTVFALAAEVIEFTIAARYTAKYGGSRRAGWGAILGGIAGALVGVPVPIIGSVLGAFAGSFVGAYVAETTRRSGNAVATRVASGALLGRAVAAAIKTAFGIAIAAWLLFAAWR